MWICPKCGKEFVDKNQYHSCSHYTLSALFVGKPNHIMGLFERFQRIVEACGPVKMFSHRGKMGFTVRVRYAGVVPKAR